MKKITIQETKEGVKLEASDLKTPEFINLTLSAVLHVLNQTVANAPDEHQKEVKEHLFDMFNEAASTLLAQFAPDIDLRPDITEEAILKLELQAADKVLKEKNKSKDNVSKL